MRFLAALSLLLLSACAGAQTTITDIRWLPPTANEQAALDNLNGKLHDLPLPFTPYDTMRPKVPERREVMADRNEYMADDPVGQFLVLLLGERYNATNAALKLTLAAADGKVVAVSTLQPVNAPKLAFLLDLKRLPAGEYEMRAALENVPAARPIQSCRFSKSKESRQVIPFPKEGVPLVVHAQNHMPNGAWPITTGVPLPRHAASDLAEFALLENGRPVPAQFTQRATWYPTGEVKWMGLDFLARYDNGKPRDYRLVRRAAPAAATPLQITETPEAFVIDTGAIRFKVGRKKFAGIEEVLLKGADGQMKPIVQGEGGPFLMDERLFRYSSASDEETKVIVEESGPIKVTLYATGWYCSDDRGEKSCLYQTRLSAYAGQPIINVNHRTILTYDTDRKKLRQLGFAVKVPGGTGWAFGGDGQTKAGDMPQATKDKNNKVVPAATVWLHQDRWDHFRLVKGAETPIINSRLMEGTQETIAEGKTSDGWASIATPNGAVSVCFRNIWQLFPKELEVSGEELNVHFWPRHGRVAFTEEEELAAGSIYKLFYAHQGDYLDLKFPQKYFDAIRKKMVALEQQDINALSGNGMGLAATNDFCLHFEPPKAEPAVAAWARLYQQDPHAITDPVYNGLTEVEGRFAGRSNSFPEAQRLLTDGYHGYTMSVDYLKDYGMWIWPDVHNNWSPVSMQAQWHRWWHNSHYQNVWEGLFLYFRSGEPWLYEWARNNTRHYMDVGTVNYDDPKAPVFGKLMGANFHTKGFTPWGSPRQGERCGDDYVEVGAHFVNPDANLFRYLLLGDRRGLELMQAWGRSFHRAALPPERSRECNTALGEMLSYYVNTWDPQAILYYRDLANDQNSRPFKEDPNFPAHPLFHDRWVLRYWELTRDPMMKQRILEWFQPETAIERGKYAYPQIRALAWQWTGRKEYLTEYLPNLSAIWEGVYLNPDDPLNLFGARGHFFPTHSQAQMLPYYLQALLDAGITAAPPPIEDGAPVAKTAEIKKGQPSPYYLATAQNAYWIHKIGYLMPKGAEPVVTLEVTGYVSNVDAMLPQSVSPGHVRISDADGNVLLDTTVLYGSKRPSATVTLDARKNKAPWKIYKSATDPTIKWTGAADALFLGPTPEAVRQAVEGKKVAVLGASHADLRTYPLTALDRHWLAPDCDCH